MRRDLTKPEHPSREAIVAWISCHPGTTFRRTCSATGRAQGTVAFHLRNLKKRRLIVEVPYRGRRLFFPKGYAVPSPEVAALLQEPVLWSVRDWVAAHPGAAQYDVLDHFGQLGWSRSTTQHRLERLVKAGLVSKKARGRFLLYFVPQTRVAEPLPLATRLVVEAPVGVA